MRKVLAITVALMIAAIVIMPALGYTNQAVGNQSYSAKSGNHVEYSFKTLNVPAHNLTPDMVTNKYSFKSAAVQSTRMPYSFQQGAATPYSLKLEGVKDATPLGMKTKPVAKLGSMNKVVEPVAAPVVNEPVAAPVVNEPVAAPVVNEPVVAPVVNETVVAPVVNETVVSPVNETKFTIEGLVADINQTGLAGWTMNLTKDGAVINSVPTAADGKFAFPDLAAGEYTVSEDLKQGWSIISPAEGKSVVTITNASVTDLVFVNQPAA
ncbi:MAG: hypothetical protein NTU95_08855 [Methanothrix sp.]|nr:hypothetical protein [Methanothrix sp.]